MLELIYHLPVITILVLIVLAAAVLWYREKKKEEAEKPEEPVTPEERRKVIWQDGKRKLYMEGNEPILVYQGETYTFGCQPYEPMTLIYRKGEEAASIHNAFRVEDECEVLLSGQLVHSITGKYHNAERFTRLLTTAIDWGCNQIGEAEDRMIKDMVFEKGDDAIEYAAYDFHCEKVLYEGVALVVGYFGDETVVCYALGFGYPHKGTDMYEYYLISRKEYLDYMQWEENKQWESHEAAYQWHEEHLAGRQVLCNEFEHMVKSYKPYFYRNELPKNYQKK